jgi:glycogen operon protein
MSRAEVALLSAALAAVACDSRPASPEAAPLQEPAEGVPALGGHFDASSSTYTFAVRSSHASRIEVELFAASLGEAAKLSVVMTPVAGSDEWTASVAASAAEAAGLGAPVYYGYRAWGPNWPYVAGWTPGSSLGFVSSWEGAGNTFDPNKLLIDPYTREISHDPLTPGHEDASVYSAASPDDERDDALTAPKSIVLAPPAYDTGKKPSRPLAKDVIYEVHVRGFTENDPSIPSCGGTYRAAAAKARWLESLGVTAIELLPVNETENDIDDLVSSRGHQNYWGYSTLAYFTVDRWYACDQSPGGPTAEFAAMVKAMHDEGIKVFLDVVYNHTAEGGGQTLYSWRGLDDPTYYEIDDAGDGFVNDTNVGANVNVANPVTEDLILDAVRYFSNDLGVDGFRFDEGAELGNACEAGCFRFDATRPGGLLAQIPLALPHAAIIAEPWAFGPGSDQQGHFPAGWSEWNGVYRDLVRTLENRLGTVATPLSGLVDAWSGSPSLFASRSPAASINYVVSHDGFTLRDEFACEEPDDTQPWPYGPSGYGASDETQWNQNGDVVAQEQAERVAIALLATSVGVPMITGGDELGRTLRCNDNAYNLDSIGNWLDWSAADATRTAFVAGAFALRAAHPSLSPEDFRSGTDHDGNGMPDVAWFTADGTAATTAYLGDTSQTFLAFELDAAEYGEADAAVMVAYNAAATGVAWSLPAPPGGTQWYAALDTSAAPGKTTYVEPPGSEVLVAASTYATAARTVVVLVAR